MKIETELNPGDEVFFLHDKKVIQSTVQKIKIEVSSQVAFIVTYLCNSEKDSNVNLKVDEGFAFKTKKELLNSL